MLTKCYIHCTDKSIIIGLDCDNVTRFWHQIMQLQCVQLNKTIHHSFLCSKTLILRFKWLWLFFFSFWSDYVDRMTPILINNYNWLSYFYIHIYILDLLFIYVFLLTVQSRNWPIIILFVCIIVNCYLFFLKKKTILTVTSCE